MNNSTIVFISAGLKQAKKGKNPFAQYHYYLNYGLLGLASILYRKGFNTKVYHGHYNEPISFAKSIFESIIIDESIPLFLSLPSVFAIDWARDFIHYAKSIYPNLKIIVGGRWVVENDGQWIKNILPEVNLVVYGTAENRIEYLLDPNKWNSIQNTDLSLIGKNESHLLEYPQYEYEILSDYNEFNPVIEVSRGCGLGCSFCLEKSIPLMKIKQPQNIMSELNKIQTLYKESTLTPYFEASYFFPSLKWTKQFSSEYISSNHTFKWRAETRIENMSEAKLTHLAASGLKILDVGLESASIQQLELMNKSHNAAEYLRKASHFLSICKSLNIWTKVNVLLYAGETEATINETIEWLEKHKDSIKGVSVNSLVVYGRDRNTINYLDDLKSLGASPVTKDVTLKGYTYMNLSNEISYEKADEYRQLISKSFMTHDDYFDLKTFSYFKKSLTKLKFNQICADSDKNILPFSF